jgi:hypothetical protein
MTPICKHLVIIVFLFLSFSFTSCNGWTEKDKAQFIESCETLKLDRDYCDCVLENAMKQYSSMSVINDDEKAMAEIITSPDCLNKIDDNTVID